MKTSPERLERERLRYIEKKDHIKSLTDAYREANRELLRQKAKQYRIEKREQIKQRKVLQYQETKMDCNARSRANYALNREKYIALNKQWAKDNPEKMAVIRANRDKRVKGSGKLSKGIANKLMVLQKGRCACCGKSLNEGFHLDHVMPLALGGENVDSNIQLLTPTCNLKKKALHPIDYMQSKGRLL